MALTSRSPLFLSLSLFPFPSFAQSLSLCFPLLKLRAIMNASIFHLVPSALTAFVPTPLAIPLLLHAEAVPIFLVQFFSFQLAPFTRYRSLANGTRLPFAFIRNGVPASDGLADCRPISATFALLDRVDDTRGTHPDVSFLATGIDIQFPTPLPRTGSFSHVAKLVFHERQQRKEIFLHVSLIFPPRRPLYFPLVSHTASIFEST